MVTTQNHLTIGSFNNEAFKDRAEAGQLLAKALSRYKKMDPVILGVPRGGLVVAREVALAFKAPLDIILTRKLGAPFNPELAVGAVTEDGRSFINEDLAHRVGADDAYIRGEIDNQMIDIRQRIKVYRSAKSKVSLKDRVVIIIDDGVATGATLQAAIWTAQQESPKKTVVAVPLGTENTLMELGRRADEVICLRSPDLLRSVGEFYQHFEQIPEQVVVGILKETAS